ncbi:ankyrin repeat-containing domain protein [Dactylonectria estremocensis]|uniref:Ankyrin repeat-containing domain protein n=1 Tax=Dactylonectria estremocensis TaxID=1079267 RepID=A0A9P9ISY3_9HYPO|nr:ankyrin repeat-containing domain protein [Dactylonectria estremocensis]
MSVNWDAYRPEVIQLYVDGKKTAEQTVKYLNDKHGVDITLRQFKMQYGNLKNLQAKEWRAVFQEIRKRKAEGKDSEVCLFGRRLNPSRVNRARRRYNKSTEPGSSVSTFDENRLNVRTPTSESIEPATETDFDEGHLGLRHQESQETFGSQYSPSDSCRGDLILAALFGEENPVEANCDKRLSPVSANLHPTNNQQTYQVSHATLSSSPNVDFVARLQDSFSADLQHILDFTDRASTSFFSQSTGPVQYAISPAYQDTESIWQDQRQIPSLPRNISTGIDPWPSNNLGCLSPQLGSFWASKAILDIFPELRGTGTFPVNINCQLIEVETLETSGLVASHLARVDPALNILRPIATIIEHITVGKLGSINIAEPTVQQILALSAYLVSNTALPRFDRQQLIEWAISSGHARTLSAFLQRCSEVPAAHALIRNILEAVSLGGFGRHTSLRNFDLFKSHPREALNLLLAADRRMFPSSLGARLLVHAANADHLAAVQLLIDRGADVNGLSSVHEHNERNSWTPLSRAAINGSEELIKFLIRSGAIVGTQLPRHNGKKKTALGLAVESQNVEAVAALLAEVGTDDPGQEDSESMESTRSGLDWPDPSLLVKAAEEGREALLKVLLTESISADEVLECALYHAVLDCKVEALATLLSLGVDPNARKYRLLGKLAHDASGSESDNELDKKEFDRTNPILLALGHGLWKVRGSRATWMREATWSDKCPMTPELMRMKHLTVSNKPRYMAYLLARAGARLSLEAVHRRRVKIEVGFCHILFSIGRNVSLIGSHVLESEAAQGNLYSCVALLDIGVPIDSYGRAGLSGLQAAAKRRHLTLVQYFLDRGADINLPAGHFRGRTALQAAAGSDPSLVDYFVNAGADITAPPAKVYGQSVLEAVISSLAWRWRDAGDRANLFRKLLKLGAPINPPGNWPESQVLHWLVQNNDIQCLKLAIQAGARIDGLQPKRERGVVGVKDESRRTALQIATNELNEKATQLLLESGASVNATSRDKTKVTALQCALGAYCPPQKLQARSHIVKLLLSSGANINSPAGPYHGRTALQAAVSCERPDLDIIRLLLDGGANVNAKPSRKSGITALQGAAIQGEIQVARLLLDHGAEINASAGPVQGWTAIEGAAKHGRLDMVSFLLQMGAAPVSVTGFSKAIGVAERRNFWEIVDLLKESQDAFNALAVSSCEPSA